MTRTTKHDWLLQGLRLLTDQGAENLTIDAITQQMGMTKGSFYHHFDGYQGFIDNLLTLYENEGTLQIIEIAEGEKTAAQKLQRLLDITTQFAPDLEIAFRAWSLQNPQVREVQKRIDAKRLEYVQMLCSDWLGDKQKGYWMAHLIYLVHIGRQQIVPPFDGQMLAALYGEIQQFYGFDKMKEIDDEHSKD